MDWSTGPEDPATSLAASTRVAVAESVPTRADAPSQGKAVSLNADAESKGAAEAVEQIMFRSNGAVWGGGDARDEQRFGQE